MKLAEDAVSSCPLSLSPSSCLLSFLRSLWLLGNIAIHLFFIVSLPLICLFPLAYRAEDEDTSGALAFFFFFVLLKFTLSASRFFCNYPSASIFPPVLSLEYLLLCLSLSPLPPVFSAPLHSHS